MIINSGSWPALPTGVGIVGVVDNAVPAGETTFQNGWFVPLVSPRYIVPSVATETFTGAFDISEGAARTRPACPSRASPALAAVATIVAVRAVGRRAAAARRRARCTAPTSTPRAAAAPEGAARLPHCISVQPWPATHCEASRHWPTHLPRMRLRRGALRVGGALRACTDCRLPLSPPMGHAGTGGTNVVARCLARAPLSTGCPSALFWNTSRLSRLVCVAWNVGGRPRKVPGVAGRLHSAVGVVLARRSAGSLQLAAARHVDDLLVGREVEVRR